MFKKVTRSIAHQLDPEGDLVPVHSIIDHEHFQPLCLVRRKKAAMFQPSPSYKQTWYRLDDLLLPGEDDKSSTGPLCPCRDVQDSMQFTVTKSTSDSSEGSLNLCIDSTSVDLKGSASLSKGWALKLQKNHIPVPQLEALTAARKMNMNHSFIQQLQKRGQNLYVVHETIETLEEASYEESTQAEGSFMAKLYAKFCAKASRESKQSITIPKGCTLAFRAIQLAITDGAWDLEYFPQARVSTYVSDSSAQGKLKALEGELKKNCQILTNLSPDLSVVILKAIKAVMTDRNLFEELTHKMGAVLDENGSYKLNTESPDLEELLSSLECSEESHLLLLARAITYTLDALDELQEDQLLLLLESLEEKIVSQQLELVASILEHDLEHMEQPFRVDTNLLCFSREEEGELTMALVEMSGVRLHKGGAAVCTEDSFSAIAALYVSLYILNLLSNLNEVPHVLPLSSGSF